MDSFVKNAADPRQVKRSSRLALTAQERWQDDLRSVLAMETGRRVLWQLLENCRAFETPPIDASLQFWVGRQDVAHWLTAQINDVDGDKLYLMAKEARAFRSLELEHAKQIHDREEKDVVTDA